MAATGEEDTTLKTQARTLLAAQAVVENPATTVGILASLREETMGMKTQQHLGAVGDQGTTVEEQDTGDTQAQSSAPEAVGLSRPHSRNAPWSFPPWRPIRARRPVTGPPVRRSDRPSSCPCLNKSVLDTCHDAVFPWLWLRSGSFAFLMPACISNVPVRKRDLCFGDRKRIFSPPPLAHGMENKTVCGKCKYLNGFFNFWLLQSKYSKSAS